MLAHIPYLRRQTRRSWFQEELALPCILRYVKIFYFWASANILVSLFWSLWLFLHFTHWFSEGWQRFCSSRANWEACEKLLPICLIPNIHLAGKGIHQRSMTMYSRSFNFIDAVRFSDCFIPQPFLENWTWIWFLSFYHNLSITDRGWWGSSWGENRQPRWEDWGNVLHMPCIPWINCLWNYDYKNLIV